MQYQKLISGETVIEFHNNWLGEETVIVNGQVVSKLSSVWGAHHRFEVIENAQKVVYVLTSKVDGNLQVLLDLTRDGILVQQNVQVNFGTRPKRPKNIAKKSGITSLHDYDLEDAVMELNKAAEIEPKDPEIYFYLACAYSLLERPAEGFESIRKAVEYQLPDTEIILNHDKLAYLRLHPAFEDFLQTNFTQYNLSQTKPERE